MITTPDLTQLDPAQVAALQAEILQRLTAAYPTLDFGRGVLGDRVYGISSVLCAAIRAQIAQLQASMSLSALAANPALADADTVAALLSNYFVTPAAGVAASGPVTFVVSQPTPLTIPAGATFAAGAVALVAPGATAVRTAAAAVTASTDRVLQPVPGGHYAFTITLQAVATGAGGNLARGVAVVPDAPPAGFVQAYVESQFSGGVDAQDPIKLANRLQDGIGARAWSNRATIRAMVLAQPQFAALAGISIVGAGDPELVRSRHGLIPISRPGYCDVYVRSAPALETLVLTKTATLVAVTAAGGVWQFSVAAADAPGFYDAAGALPAGTPPQATGYAITSDVRAVDTSGASWAPDVATPVEAAYSSVSAATLQLTDPDTPTAGLAIGSATKSYDVTLRVSSLVGPLQAFLGGRSVRPPAGDVLVKGAVPCAMRVAVDLWLPAGVAAPDPGPIAAAMAAVVNDGGFAGQVFAADLAEAAAPLLPAGASLGRWDLFGSIRAPDGGTIYLHDAVVLSIPSIPDRQVTANTAAFFLDPADVSLNARARTGPST